MKKIRRDKALKKVRQAVKLMQRDADLRGQVQPETAARYMRDRRRMQALLAQEGERWQNDARSGRRF